MNGFTLRTWVCVLLVGGLLGLPDAAAASKKVTVDSRFAPAPDTLGDGVQFFLDTLEAVNFGRPQLVPTAGTHILQAVNNGDVDLGIDVLSLQDTGDDQLNEALDQYGESVPFGLQGFEYIAWLEEEGIAELEEILAEKGFDNVGIWPLIANTGQSAAMSTIPINDESLSAGFLMRSFGYGQLVLAEAYPQMEFVPATGGSTGNIVAGFNDGSLDAAEFVNPCIDTTAILDLVDPETVGHYYIDNWQSPITLSFLMYRKDLGPPFDLDRLRAAQQASLAASFPRLMRRQSECLAGIAERGIQLGNFDDDVLEALRSATFTVLGEAAASNPYVARVLDSQREFINRNQLWLNDGPIDRDSRWVGWPGYESDL